MLKLENGKNVGRARYTARNITGLTAHKEAPSALLLTHLGQLLQPEKLPNGTSVPSQQDLMQRPVLLRRPRLKTRLIARHGREILPNPPNHLVALLHAAKVVRQHGLVGSELRGVQRGELRVPPRANKQDVAELDGGPLRGEAGLEVGEGDGRGFEAGEGLDLRIGVGGAPGGEVNEDAAAYDSFLGEGCKVWLCKYT